MNLYPKNSSPRLDPELFRNPTAEYRGTPFWSWNNKLDRDQLLRQIDQLKQMGFGGFHMHPRTGLATPYLGDEFMNMIRACTEKAAAENMLAWLYDEDRWPSGFAGGLVTCEEKYRLRYLLWTSRPYCGAPPEVIQWSGAFGGRNEKGVLLARYAVTLKDGQLAQYRRLEEDENNGAGTVWYAYLETSTPTSWYNNQTYVDTMNVEAIQRFLEITYDRYAEVVGQYFGNVIPSIFTDEPQFAHKSCFNSAGDNRDLRMPFTDDFPTTYQREYGQNLLDFLPELFWDLPDGAPSLARYRFHDHSCERFTHAFADIVGDWCQEHGIALTGHMMEEPTLGSQTAALGEAMRLYRGFQIPGIDLLCDRREFNTAKQAQSAAHQYGRPGVMSELYGVTNWDFDFVGHKGQGDWQAALGITVRVPHLNWVSMAGEAKRDYPAAIGYQSPWYLEYGLIENYFSRLNTALTRGKPGVRVGVIHPIESYWLCFGPREQTKLEREEREANFLQLTDWLLYGQVDFDFICESLLPSQHQDASGSQFVVGEMKYDAVIVPGMRTIRGTTLAHLEEFNRRGGKVIFAGEIPSLVDAAPSARPAELAACSTHIPLSRTQVLKVVEPYRDVEVRLNDGGLADTLLYQLREDGDRRYLFLCNTHRKHARPDCTVKIQGEWAATHVDAMTGDASVIPTTYEGGQTLIHWSFTPHGSVLLELTPGRAEGVEAIATPKWRDAGLLAGPVPVTLSEPNVLLLNQAQYRLDDSPWQETEELLRIDAAARRHWNLRARGGQRSQPWVDTEPAPTAGQLRLRFTVDTEISLNGLTLALEAPDSVEISVDGNRVTESPTGWWVDESIRTVPLPALQAGRHTLELRYAFSRDTNLEWSYLLGDFGVKVLGRTAVITAPVRQLAYGDWTKQGLPFYAGNVTYHCTIDGTGEPFAVATPKFKAPLISAALDGQPAGKIAFAPFQLELGNPSVGPHQLDLTVYGNRFNAFGCVHNADEELTWFGPNCWRTTGEAWAYEYQLKAMGILVAPVVRVKSS